MESERESFELPPLSELRTVPNRAAALRSDAFHVLSGIAEIQVT